MYPLLITPNASNHPPRVLFCHFFMQKTQKTHVGGNQKLIEPIIRKLAVKGTKKEKKGKGGEDSRTKDTRYKMHRIGRDGLVYVTKWLGTKADRVIYCL